MILKNSFGITAVLTDNNFKKIPTNAFTGSSLDRKNKKKKESSELDPELTELIKDLILEQPEVIEPKIKTEKKDKFMSSRTKSKIRKKIIALSQLYKRLSFLTLTFVNKIDDEKAVIILRKFLDNIKKRSTDFQYLWVAEKQTKNTTFEDNIHFHLITNKFWDVKKYWEYWLELQQKNGIIPREADFKPSSSFDVKGLVSNNIKGISSYLTKYVTKNKSTFKCQVWNCSKKISALYTGFYSDYSFLENIRRVEGIEIKEVPLEYCNLHLIPLNRLTMGFYDRLRDKNRRGWGKV